MSAFTWRHAWSPLDAEIVRQLRNAGRNWFGEEGEIAVEDQQRWWEKQRSQIECVLVGDPPIGYGMLRRRDGRWWVSLAVDAAKRGQGWGTRIYGILPRLVAEPIFAGIRQDNTASLQAAERAGYVRVPVIPPGVDSQRVEAWIVLSHSGDPR